MADTPLKIFICYAREDREPLNLLRKKLSPLVHSGRIQLWYDGEIVGGKEWDLEIKFNLKSADIILLLISDDFFESDYIKSVELREALDGHAREEHVVVPVILYDCLWYAHPELARLQALPDEARPVFMDEHWRNPDLGFANVARGIFRILDDTETSARRQRKNDRIRQETEAAERQRRDAEAARKKQEEAVQRKREMDAQAAAKKQQDENLAREKALQPEMVQVKGGPFKLGDQVSVAVADFALGKYPVTQKLWREIMGDNPSHFKGDDLPVENVSWDDVQQFLTKLNTRFPGKNYRLPSEAEWEYAARGGRLSKGFEYAGSNNLHEVGWFWENSGDKPLSGEWTSEKLTKNNCRTHPVGQKLPNELGLYDMSGNVWEWCADDWHSDLAYAPKDGSAWVDQPERGALRVNRGGSWLISPGSCRVSPRGSWGPDARGLGFRLASSPQ